MSMFKFIYSCCCHTEGETVNNLSKNARNSEKDFLKVQEARSDIGTPSSFYMDEQVNIQKLEIKVIESNIITPGMLFNITPFTLEHLKKGKFNKEWRFGLTKSADGEAKYDFIAKEEVNNIKTMDFSIKYIAKKLKYFISDLDCGTGTFVKINSMLKLRDGYIFSFGSYFMTVVCSSKINLLIKILEGPSAGETFSFLPKNQPIFIGRAPSCQIVLRDQGISKTQCKINYSLNKGWTISDGNTSKSSTNGTWLFTESKFEVYDKMIIKSGKTLFQVHFL